MNYRAIFLGALMIIVLGFVILLLAGITEEGRFTGPQLMTVSALWILPGFFSGHRAGEAGILHGMLAGLAGGFFVALEFSLATQLSGESALLGQLSARGGMILLILGGLWGASGGMFADIVRVVRSRKSKSRLRADSRLLRSYWTVLLTPAAPS